MVFGFENDIARSVAIADGGLSDTAPGYAAVKMLDGTLNVDVNAPFDPKSDRNAGSFYSYFGTQPTYCIHITGGTMNVSTTGEISTVDPARLPRITSLDTSKNSAKYSEGACIFSEKVTGGKDGTLNITKLDKATSYNGSVISASGGSVTIANANITKNATMSHTDDPFAFDDTRDEGTTSTSGSQFPANKQYRDAAIFINGGTIKLDGVPIGGMEENGQLVDYQRSVNITVNKNIVDFEQIDADGNYVPFAPDERLDKPYTTFGILSRGREGTKSSFTSTYADITMQGAHSYAVFGTRGSVSLTHSRIEVDSDNNCYGIYAENKTTFAENLVNITLDDTSIKVGKTTQYSGSVMPSIRAGTTTTTLCTRARWM